MKRNVFCPCVFLLTIFLTFTSCSKNISGTWETKNVQFKLKQKDIPKILLENSKAIAYATMYEFKPDNSFILFEKANDANDNIELKYAGMFNLNNDMLKLKSDTLFARKTGGEWNTNVVTESQSSHSRYDFEFEITRQNRNKIVLKQKLNHNEGYILITLKRTRGDD